jgi:hypothetical protein
MMGEKEDKMTNFVGGLYTKQGQAEAAYQALRAAGFSRKDLAMLVRKPEQPPEFASRASLGDVARHAGIGALALGILSGILALLVGAGAVSVQGIFPNFEPGVFRTTLGLTVISALIGAFIGGVLGAVYTYGRSSEKVEIEPEGVKRGGLLVVVNVDDSDEETAHKLMAENGAVDVKNLTQTWDAAAWSRLEGYGAGERQARRAV